MRFLSFLMNTALGFLHSPMLAVQLLQRLLDDRRPTVEMIRAEGERISSTADAQDREKIQMQLQSLAERWRDLLDKASSRYRLQKPNCGSSHLFLKETLQRRRFCFLFVVSMKSLDSLEILKMLRNKERAS